MEAVLTAGRQEAERQRVPVTLTIVDTGGHVRAVWRAEGCSYFALGSSRVKAITALQLCLPSHVVGEISQQFPVLQASFAANPEITGLPGGFPLQRGGVVVGGLGVAGGNFEQDQRIALVAAGAESSGE